MGAVLRAEAVEEGGYESNNAIFKSPEGGEILVAETERLLRAR